MAKPCRPTVRRTRLGWVIDCHHDVAERFSTMEDAMHAARLHAAPPVIVQQRPDGWWSWRCNCGTVGLFESDTPGAAEHDATDHLTCHHLRHLIRTEPKGTP